MTSTRPIFNSTIKKPFKGSQNANVINKIQNVTSIGRYLLVVSNKKSLVTYIVVGTLKK